MSGHRVGPLASLSALSVSSPASTAALNTCAGDAFTSAGDGVTKRLSRLGLWVDAIRQRLLEAALAVAFYAGTTATAAAISISSSDQGWYSPGGLHTPTNTNIKTGDAGENGYHNFFVFDLAPIAGMTATSGSLTIFGSSTGVAGYSGTVDPQETYEIYNFSGAVSSLIAGTGGVSAYDDLGSGDLYGHVELDTPFGYFHPMPQVDIALSAAALLDINALITGSTALTFVIGGNCATCNSVAGDQHLWEFSGNLVPAARLTLEIAPVVAAAEPTTMALFGAGLVAVALVAGRHPRGHRFRPLGFGPLWRALGGLGLRAVGGHSGSIQSGSLGPGLLVLPGLARKARPTSR